MSTENTNNLDIEEEKQIGVVENSVYKVTKILTEWMEKEEEV